VKSLKISELSSCCVWGGARKQYGICRPDSVSDLDPHGSLLLKLSWNRILIRIGNADPDLDPEAMKLNKINK
jgi:hypothetical protein